MAVSITSRYRSLGIFEAADASGRTHPTVPIRRHQPTPAGAPVYGHRVTGAEDIEYLAWRFYGTGEAWYQIADGNPVAFPLDLRAGAAINIPPQGDVGRLVNRERSF